MTNKFTCYLCKEEWNRVGPRLIEDYLPDPEQEGDGDRVSLCDGCSDIVTKAMAEEGRVNVTTEEVEGNG